MFLKYLLLSLLFLSCSSSWVIKKQTPCSATIYIESVHNLTKGNFKSLDKQYYQLLDDMASCDPDSINIKWKGLVYLYEES